MTAAQARRRRADSPGRSAGTPTGMDEINDDFTIAIIGGGSFPTVGEVLGQADAALLAQLVD